MDCIFHEFLDFDNSGFTSFWLKIFLLEPQSCESEIKIPNSMIRVLHSTSTSAHKSCHINTKTSKWWQYVSRRLFCRAWKSSLMAISSMPPMIWSNSVTSVSSMNTSSSSTKPAEKKRILFSQNIKNSWTYLALLEYYDLKRIWVDSLYDPWEKFVRLDYKYYYYVLHNSITTTTCFQWFHLCYIDITSPFSCRQSCNKIRTLNLHKLTKIKSYCLS